MKRLRVFAREVATSGKRFVSCSSGRSGSTPAAARFCFSLSDLSFAWLSNWTEWQDSLVRKPRVSRVLTPSVAARSSPQKLFNCINKLL
jgi:hypothetical protein